MQRATTILFSLLGAAFLCLSAFGVAYADELTLAAEFNPREVEGSRTFEVSFDDSWLLQDDKAYNHKLAQASMGLAVSAARDSDSPLGQQQRFIRAYLDQAGFADLRFEGYDQAPGVDTMSCALGQKRVGDTTLVVVALCGGKYGAEWAGNFSCGDSVRHEGFDYAAKLVEQRIWDYVAGIEGEMRVWLAGYSRGAAVANLVAADLIDSGRFSAVYGYTFATPANTKDAGDPARYSSIFNIAGKFDPVPYVALPDWGYTRYGTTLYRPAPETDSDFARYAGDAERALLGITGLPLKTDPAIDIIIHDVLEYLSIVVPDSSQYDARLQEAVFSLWTDDIPKVAVPRIIGCLEQIEIEDGEQAKALDALLDYLAGVGESALLNRSSASVSGVAAIVDEPLLLAYEHFEEVNAAWLLSSVDGGFLNQKTGYTRFTFDGDVSIDVFDTAGFVQTVQVKGEGRTSEDLESTYGSAADGQITAARIGGRTILLVPQDMPYGLIINSLKDQQLRCVASSYSAASLHPSSAQDVTFEAKGGDAFYASVLGGGQLATWARDGSFLGEWKSDNDALPSLVLSMQNSRLFDLTINEVLTALKVVVVAVVALLAVIAVIAIRAIARKAKAGR